MPRRGDRSPLLVRVRVSVSVSVSVRVSVRVRVRVRVRVGVRVRVWPPLLVEEVAFVTWQRRADSAPTVRRGRTLRMGSCFFPVFAAFFVNQTPQLKTEK